MDSSGTALAARGAATATFAFTTHAPYLLASQAQLPRLLHRSEASLLIVQYSSLVAAGVTPHTYTLFWRAIDPATSRAVASGTSALGTVPGGGSGTFFAPFHAPALRGTYRLQLEVREGTGAVSRMQTLPVDIGRSRTYPDDRAGLVVRAPGATAAPRAPQSSSSAWPHGRSPSPPPP